MTLEAVSRARWGHPVHARGCLTVTAAAATLAAGGHIAGGGRIALDCPSVVGGLGLALITTWAAVRFGARHRSVWSVIASLGVGQGAIEGLLSAPVDGAPNAPALTALLHLGFTLALGVAVLGTDRVVTDLLGALDRVLPRWWRALVGALPATGPELRPLRQLPALTPREHEGRARTLRGPPRAA